MPPFQEVGQEPGSLDCGYFSAYALMVAQTSDGQFANMIMSQEEVYAERDAWLGGSVRTSGGPSQTFLWPQSALDFLTYIGLNGYRAENVLTVRGVGNIVARLRTSLASGGGAMVAQLGTLNHWVTIIGVAGDGRWAFYDPAPQNNNIHARLFPAEAVAGQFVTNGFGYVISLP